VHIHCATQESPDDYRFPDPRRHHPRPTRRTQPPPSPPRSIFLYSEKDPTWLSFKFKGSRKANYLKVTLDLATDTYTLQIMKLRGYNFKDVYEASGLDAGQVRSTIEAQTGLYLSL